MAVDRPASRNVRRQIALAAAVGLALRLAFGLIYWVDKPMTHDEHEYLALAEGVAAGRGFTYAHPPAGTTVQFGRAPGYPAFLAAIGAGTTTATSAPRGVKVAQALLGALTICLVAIAAMQAAGASAAIAAAWLTAFYPPLIWISSYVLSESLYSLLAIGTAVTLQAAIARAQDGDGRSSLRLTAAAGLLCGVSILVRPAMLFFLPLGALWLLRRRAFITARGAPPPRALARQLRASLGPQALALVVAAILVVAPWTMRNFGTHGRFVLVATEGGVTFWTGNHPLARGEGDLAANPDLKRAELEFRRAHAELNADQLEPLYYRDAFGHIAADPIWWAGLLVRKAFYTVVPIGPSYALHSWRYRTASVISYVLLLPFAVAGAIRLWRSPRRPVALLLLAAASGLVCIMFFPQERFRIPVIDPVLIVCAAALASTRDMTVSPGTYAGQ